MKAFTYRLQVLLDQTEERKRAAARDLLHAESERETQHQTMHRLQRSLQELVGRRKQMREELFRKPEGDGLLNAMKVQERIGYVEAVSAQIGDVEGDIAAQSTVIEACEHRVRQVQKCLQDTSREVEVLQKHRAKQEERFRREASEQEERSLDEIGNVLYTTRRSSR